MKVVRLHNKDSSCKIIRTSDTVIAHKGGVLIQYCELLLLCEFNIIMEKSITRDDQVRSQMDGVASHQP